MTTRRLAAILAADVVGFSSLMEKDEEGTLRRVKALQREVIEPRVKERGGRLVKTTGDGFLCEFGSPVEAVRCALEMQEAASAKGSSDLLLRMGINLGDIIVEPDGDIYGDGVNVAARLEQLAEPGGVCISGSVHEHAEGKVGVRFESRGEQQVKNMDRPVRVYALAGGAQKVSEPKPLALPDKPSIAVLPFTNMSDDRETDWFADGVVEDIITDLTRLKSLFVIARNSSFTYKGRAVDVKQVGRELGVRYVLEGSVRRAGDRLRLTGQLIDAATGAHLWAERFDGALQDVFDLQDEIRARVLGALAPNLEMLELARARAKPTAILDAYDLTLRAHANLRLAARESAHEAIQLCAAANRLDPDYALPYAIAGMSYTQLKSFNWMSDPAAEIAKASWFAKRAIQLGPDNPMVLAWAGHIVSNIDRDLETGSRTCERALSISPNYAPALVYTAFARIWNGEPEVAVERLKRAFRLSPVDPDIPWWHAVLAHAHFHSEAYSRAVSAALVALTDAELPDALRILAASYGHAGASGKALATVSRLQRVSPALSLSTLRETLGPYEEADFRRYYKGLRLAGLPE